MRVARLFVAASPSRPGPNLWAASVMPAVVILAFSTAAAAQSLVWIPEGPAPSTEGGSEGIEQRPVAGAIEVALPHPTKADVVYVAAVNGGVWKTDNATAAKPEWQPLSDGEKSLSMGALAFDPTDGTYETMVAGTGRFSSYGSGGALVGILRTTNGGKSWTLIDGGGLLKNTSVTGVAPRGKIIVVATDKGVFRSSDNGVWTKLSGAASSGLPDGGAFALASDPTNPARLYTNAGAHGLYRSEDTGTTWTKISDDAMDKLLIACSPRVSTCTRNIKISVGKNNNVYVAIANRDPKPVPYPPAWRCEPPRVATDKTSSTELVGLFRSGDGGDSWTALDRPLTVEGGNVCFGLHTGGQGDIHLSLLADPNNANVAYIGGDSQPHHNQGLNVDKQAWPNSVGAKGFTGRLFRIDASLPPGSQATHITHSHTTSGTAPHADSRGMAFTANGDLIEVDDGGIYRRTRPETNDGDWSSMNGDIQTTELHSVAWDANSHLIIGGAQDNGTPQQFENEDREWEDVGSGDGGVVAVDDSSTPGYSTRYSSSQYLADFQRVVYDADNALEGRDDPKLTLIGGGTPLNPKFYTPVVLNGVQPTRLIIGGGSWVDNRGLAHKGSVYESEDQGDTIEEIGPNIEVNENGPVAFGATGNADMLYVGSGNKVFIRMAAKPAPLVASPAYPGTKEVVGIAIDPSDPKTAFVIDPTKVYQTTDAGASWTYLTGNLESFEPGVLRSVAYAPGLGDGTLVVGTNAGVFATSSPRFSEWRRLGSGLPTVPVFRLQYSVADNLLLAGTLGRGAWTLSFKKAP